MNQPNTNSSFSKDQPAEYQQKPATANFTAKGALLYILPTPLFINLLFSIGNIARFTSIIIVLILFYSAAYLNRKTQKQLAQNLSRAHHAKIDDYRKKSMLLLGVAVFVMFFLLVRSSIVYALFFSLLSIFGFYLCYGIAAPAEQIAEQAQLQSMPTATREAINEAYKDISEIEQRISSIGKTDKTLSTLITQVVEQSYKIMSLLVKNPENAGQARKFLNVYLHRIKEILLQYIELSKHGKAEAFRNKLFDTLNEVNQAFTQQESKLLDDDIFKLDIQLEVLKEQIEKEK